MDLKASKIIILKKWNEDFILAVRSDKGWSLPGGKQEGKESVEGALVRELNEELPHIDFTLLDFRIILKRRWIDGLWLTTLFLGVWRGGEVEIGNEILEYKWMTYKELIEKAPFWKGIGNIIEIMKTIDRVNLELKVWKMLND